MNADDARDKADRLAAGNGGRASDGPLHNEHRNMLCRAGHRQRVRASRVTCTRHHSDKSTDTRIIHRPARWRLVLCSAVQTPRARPLFPVAVRARIRNTTAALRSLAIATRSPSQADSGSTTWLMACT
ncbi:hypothetical protein MRX96_051295 [Rhipicephalus microplus]